MNGPLLPDLSRPDEQRLIPGEEHFPDDLLSNLRMLARINGPLPERAPYTGPAALIDDSIFSDTGLSHLLFSEGRSLLRERFVIRDLPPRDGKGPRVLLDPEGELEVARQEFCRFDSYDHFGLAQDPRVKQVAAEALMQFGYQSGAGRFTGGSHVLHRETEHALASFLGKRDAFVATTGSVANMAVVCGLALADEQTFFLSEQANHESIKFGIDGSRLPRTNLGVYRHVDMADLREKIAAIPGGINQLVVISDGVFGGTGEVVPLNELVAVARAFESRFSRGVRIVIDDSQGIGILGASGRGTQEHWGQFDVDVITGSLNKITGLEGGVITGSKKLVDQIVRGSVPSVFTGALPFPACGGILASLHLMQSAEGGNWREKVHENTGYFRERLEANGFQTIIGPTGVVPLEGYSDLDLQFFAYHLLEKGILASTFRYPLMPENNGVIRFQIRRDHTRLDLEEAIEALKYGREQLERRGRIA